LFVYINVIGTDI